MSANKELVLNMIECFNAQDADGLAPMLTDTVKHSAGGSEFSTDLEGKDAYVDYMKGKVFPRFKSIKFTPYSVIEDTAADVVLAEWTGNFITASGTPFSSRGALVVVFKNGKIDWVRDYFDTEKTKTAMNAS